MNLQSGTKLNDEIIFIQEKLKIITHESFDKKYIKKFYLPLLHSIKNKKKIMIAGSQGSGKSSLAILISEYLKKYYPKSSVNEQVILNSVEELLIIIKKLYKS